MKQRMNQSYVISTFLAGVFSFTTFGCASLRTELPMSRFESPEVLGPAGKFQVLAAGAAMQRYTVSNDVSKRPPDLTQPSATDTLSAYLGGGYALEDNFEIGLKTTWGPSPTQLTAKFQILGPTADTAKKGDVSLALTAAAGYAHPTKDGDQNGEFGGGGYNWEASMTSVMTDASIIAGVRLSDSMLVYASGFYSNYSIKTKIEHKLSNNGLSPAATYQLDSSAYQRGANLGLRANAGADSYFIVEYVYADARFSGNVHDYDSSYGAGFGFRF